MADYIYLIESRLTPAQQRALATIRAVAREQEQTVFLTGGAVRDMTGGGSIRDLDFTVQGNALSLKEALQAAGASIDGEARDAQRLFLRLRGGIRAEVSSAMSVTFPKPGQPAYQPTTLTDDLRSRDFTANAMAISLNEGSYGLLMDPLNGVADIENRELRLVSNYGFIEDPSRLVRAARLRSRLGWQLEERTSQRYETAKEEGYISALAPWHRGYELEEIFHEEDPVRVMRALETEGWLSALTPVLSPGKANSAALNDVAERQGQLQTQGLFAQSAALTFPLVMAKASAGEVATLKTLFVRPGFAEEIDSLDARTRDFATRLGGKEAAAPSAAWRMLHEAEPNLVLSLAYSSKSSALQGRLKTFLNDSPGARGRIPYGLMQEMRISPDLPAYGELVEKLFFELMDNKLSTTEEMKAYLEPYSPPAPPPPINLRRARAKKEARPSRAKGKKAVEQDDLPTVAAEEEAAGVETGIMEPGTLTGPNRGPDPTPRAPLAGKEAPEPGQVVGHVEPELPLEVKPSSSVSKKSKTGSEKTVPQPELIAAKPPAKQAQPAKSISAPVEPKGAVSAVETQLGRLPTPPSSSAKPAAKTSAPGTPVKQAATKLVVVAATKRQTSPEGSTVATAPAKKVSSLSEGKQVPSAKEAKPTAAKAAPPIKASPQQSKGKSAAKAVVPAVKAAAKSPVKATVPVKVAAPAKSASTKPGASKAPAKATTKTPVKPAAKQPGKR